MSNEENTVESTNPLQEVSKVVAITPEDVTGAADFWTHFEVPMPASLRSAFDNFVNDPNYENQMIVKIELCKAIGYTEHEAFNDEMFKEIVEECRNVTYDMGFDKALESAILTEEDKK